MKISEAAQMTGLDISTIRFYERKGLIKPSRAEGSTYRTYTDEDVDRIRQIMLYRKMDFSIEAIASLLDRSVNLQDALRTQEAKLLDERERVDNALDLCRKMIGDQVSGEFDVDRYTNYVREEEEKGRRYPKAVEVLDDLAFNSGRSFPLLSPMLGNEWLRRLIGVAVFLILTVVPFIVVFVKGMEWRNGQAGLQPLIFWLFYAFVCWGTILKRLIK